MGSCVVGNHGGAGQTGERDKSGPKGTERPSFPTWLFCAAVSLDSCQPCLMEAHKYGAVCYGKGEDNEIEHFPALQTLSFSTSSLWHITCFHSLVSGASQSCVMTV